jgi:threonine/homoserine/homoserine lactone efflux protein
MTGFALIITKIGWVVFLVQCAGATYLIYLGLSPWFSYRPPNANYSQRSLATKMSGQRGFRIGLIVELSNPKSIAFFLSVFAVAVPPDSAAWVKTSVLCIGFTVDIIWYSAVATLFSSKAIRAVYERFVSWIDRLLGAVLTAFGLRILADQF